MPDLLEIMKSLSDETRLKIIKLLLEHDFCVGAIARRISISESAVSQHLKVLRTAGLVKGDKRGYYTHYYVDQELLKWAAGELISLSETEKDNKSCRKRIASENDCCCKSRTKQEQTDCMKDTSYELEQDRRE